MAGAVHLHHRDRLRIPRRPASLAGVAAGRDCHSGVFRRPDRDLAAVHRALQRRVRPCPEPAAGAVRGNHPAPTQRLRRLGGPLRRRRRRGDEAASVIGRRALSAQVARLRIGLDSGVGGRLLGRDRHHRRRWPGHVGGLRLHPDGDTRRDRGRGHPLSPVRDRSSRQPCAGLRGVDRRPGRHLRGGLPVLGSGDRLGLHAADRGSDAGGCPGLWAAAVAGPANRGQALRPRSVRGAGQGRAFLGRAPGRTHGAGGDRRGAGGSAWRPTPGAVPMAARRAAPRRRGGSDRGRGPPRRPRAHPRAPGRLATRDHRA